MLKDKVLKSLKYLKSYKIIYPQQVQRVQLMNLKLVRILYMEALLAILYRHLFIIENNCF
jgi:hypothetical protein